MTGDDVDQAVAEVAARRRRRRYDPEIRRVRGWHPQRIRQTPIEQPTPAWSVGFAIGLRARLLFYRLSKRYMFSSRGRPL